MAGKLLLSALPILLLIFVSAAHGQSGTAENSTTATDAATKLKQQMQLVQEQKKTAVTQAKDEIRAALQTKREEFRVRLQTIKDQKKKALVERIDKKLAEVNKNRTAKLMDALNRIQAFLDKFIQSEANTDIRTDTSGAQAAIDTARLAIETQAAKIYTMTVVDDATLKINAGITVSQARRDLVSVYKLVVDAKQAVQKLNANRVQAEEKTASSTEQ